MKAWKRVQKVSFHFFLSYSCIVFNNFFLSWLMLFFTYATQSPHRKIAKPSNTGTMSDEVSKPEISDNNASKHVHSGVLTYRPPHYRVMHLAVATQQTFFPS